MGPDKLYYVPDQEVYYLRLTVGIREEDIFRASRGKKPRTPIWVWCLIGAYTTAMLIFIHIVLWS